MKRICVYCGSNFGDRPAYLQAAKELGIALADRDMTLVYGGGRVGLMGAIADATLAAGGQVIGIIPQALFDKELAHTGLTDLHIVGSMHERKSLMAELSDAFIAMPGGLGTFEEFFEIATWTQLGFHKKACGLLNIEGFYSELLSFLNHATNEGFIRSEHRSIVLTDEDPATLIEKLRHFEVPNVQKWIERSQR
ncbi:MULTISPECIES: TIGR00730 family Rossman fold protein [unclassified Leptolyngbya]|uniref:LOG family protein n=1 Tax=unclassified Leptolyngbya TaxID=2650499 RepID=UPI0016852197|nr:MULTISPECIES: TIGR00730 family Rossman fold protein [unclassified Leptolyngbya]MBD1912078.1 TIGR00730 family Rossman fold protein [Leptolyngbya sp. FACHB-8]MBD2153798.1 TIGR00730 family Rossman fold protein [Leptolyngbya sp. FACHB-16]